MPCLLRILVLLAAFAAASLPTRGAEPPALGPLSGSLLIGAEGPWTGSVDGAVYRLDNPGEADGVKHIAIDPRAGGWRGSIAVEVRLSEGGQQAIGGLLFALQPEPFSYLALVVESGGGVALYSRSPDGLEKMAGFDEAKLDPAAFTELRIEESDGAFDFLVNGEPVGSAATDVAGTGSVGVLAGGRGTFLFRNFTLTPAP